MKHHGTIQSVQVCTPDKAADISARFTPTAALPATSPFTDLATAKTQLVELFDAYHPRPGSPLTDVVSIRRNDWELSVVQDHVAEYALMNGSDIFPPGSAFLDSVFNVADLAYRWNRLRSIPAPR